MKTFDRPEANISVFAIFIVVAIYLILPGLLLLPLLKLGCPEGLLEILFKPQILLCEWSPIADFYEWQVDRLDSLFSLFKNTPP